MVTGCLSQVLAVSTSVPLKVSAALCAAEDAAVSLEDLLQRQQMMSELLKQVQTSEDALASLTPPPPGSVWLLSLFCSMSRVSTLPRTTWAGSFTRSRRCSAT